MEDFLTLFLDSTHWQWWAIAALLLGAEIFAPTFFLLWPGLAAIVTGFLVWLFPDMGWATQAIVFTGLALITTVIGRRYFNKTQKETDHPGLNKRESQVIGRKITLDADLKDGQGRLHLDDTTWQARTENNELLKKGTRIEIIDTDGATLIVKEMLPKN